MQENELKERKKHEQNQKNIAGNCMETHTDIRKVKGTMKGMKAKT